MGKIKIGTWKVPGQNTMFAAVPRWVAGQSCRFPGGVGAYARSTDWSPASQKEAL